MLQDCLEVFDEYEKKLDAESDLVLDNYIPKDGTYIIVNLNTNNVERILNISFDKKSKEIIGKSDSYYYDIKYYDYNSSLVSMNKPIDGKKVIHSNNFLSFFIKKESINPKKLSREILYGYYRILEEPDRKYEGKRKSKELYAEVKEDIGEVDKELLNRCKSWIENNIFELNKWDVDISGKDYLKVFFVLDDKSETKKLYAREGQRYFYPNIFNNNEYNEVFEGVTWGMPDNNMGLNSKKPYLEHRTRINTYPYLVTKDEVFRQKLFFDYLATLAFRGKVNVYFDYMRNEIFSYANDETPDCDICGIYMRLQKEKELKIIETEVVTGFKPELSKPFDYENLLCSDYTVRNDSQEVYKRVRKVSEISSMLNEVLFSKWLLKNFYTDAKDLKINGGHLKQNLLAARKTLFRWFYFGEMKNASEILKKISINLVLDSIENNSFIQAVYRMNMRLSLSNYFNWSKEDTMDIKEIRDSLKTKINGSGDSQFQNDDEYYYAVGQVLYYFLSLSKAKKTNFSTVNPILNAKSDKIIKDKLKNLFIKYDYEITLNLKRVRFLYSMVAGYQIDETKKPIRDMLISGLLGGSLIYEKVEEDKKYE